MKLMSTRIIRVLINYNQNKLCPNYCDFTVIPDPVT